VRLQARYRRWAARCPFLAMGAVALALQALARMRPARVAFIAHRRRRAATALQTAARRRAAVAHRKRVVFVVAFVAARWRGKVGRKAARARRREAQSTSALAAQVAQFQQIMRDGAEARSQLERRAADAMALLEAAEAEAMALRAQNERYRSELASRADQEMLAKSAISDLRAKNDKLVATLGKARHCIGTANQCFHTEHKKRLG